MWKDYAHEVAHIVHLPPWKGEELYPVRIGRNLAKPSYAVGPKSIEHYSLHLVLQGSVEVATAGDLSVVLPQGCCFCLFPGDVYEYRIAGQQQLRMLWFVMGGSLAEEALEQVGLTRTHYHRAFALDVRLEVELADLLEERTPAGEAELFHAQAVMYKLLASLAEQARYPDQTAWWDKAKGYMELHAAEGLRVEDVASYVGIHRSHFSTLFHAKFGIPPAAFLRELRLRKAQQLLDDRSRSVTEIALTLGFPDVYSFSRAFRVQYGKSPAAWRRG